MEQKKIKRIPYGVSDFVYVMEQNCYYVDKTMYLPLLEDCSNICSLSALVALARACS